MNPALTLGSAAGFLAVALGAFGAHALKGRLDPSALAIYQTAVQYHLIHALVLTALGVWSAARAQAPAPPHWITGSFAAGILLFSGSLYLLAVTGARWLGAITPLGGICFLVGWAGLLWVGLKGV
ncbi:MAG TPA: DUF423 domain-containing protein, partial [Bdellovibrionota bacterium]|nr:DUF423 domain-containing protein [Bdellovibrionota bacterium]